MYSIFLNTSISLSLRRNKPSYQDLAILWGIMAKACLYYFAHIHDWSTEGGASFVSKLCLYYYFIENFIHIHDVLWLNLPHFLLSNSFSVPLHTYLSQHLLLSFSNLLSLLHTACACIASVKEARPLIPDLNVECTQGLGSGFILPLLPPNYHSQLNSVNWEVDPEVLCKVRCPWMVKIKCGGNFFCFRVQ